MTSAADHERTKATADGFIQGGFRARPIPPELPPITEVEFGSVYQDADSGTMWRAVPAGQGRWRQVELVTATEHAP